jgi:hypothetical protein
VRGIQTTHYRVVIDLNKLVARGGPQAATYRQLISEINSSSLPMDVWLDSRNRVNQLQFQLTVPVVQGQPGKANVNLSLQLYDFGTPVSVTPPPADQVGILNLSTTTSTP